MKGNGVRNKQVWGRHGEREVEQCTGIKEEEEGCAVVDGVRQGGRKE